MKLIPPVLLALVIVFELGVPRTRSGAGPARAEAQGPGETTEIWTRPEACDLRARARERDEARDLRIATWNLHWFPDGSMRGAERSKRTDIAWLACAMASLDADVIAVQEILRHDDGVAAMELLLAELGKRTGHTWEAAFDECPGKRRQHVGLLFDSSRLVANELRSIAELNPGASACDLSLRPGFGGRFTTREGDSLTVVSLHFDSGVELRDYNHRQKSGHSISLVSKMIHSSRPHEPVVFAGDFNTMGCTAFSCADKVSGPEEIAGLRLDLAASGLALLAPRLPCTALMPHPVALDHFAVSGRSVRPSSRETVEVGGYCAATECTRSRRSALARFVLSDHCPIVMTLPVSAHSKREARP